MLCARCCRPAPASAHSPAMARRPTAASLTLSDITINDYANSPKCTNRAKKFNGIPAMGDSWDEIDDEYDIIEVLDEDGNKQTVLKTRGPNLEPSRVPPDEFPGDEYPEIVWYLISQHIKPEQVATFARINRTTYALTKRESFWRNLYERYCKGHAKLPDRLKIECNYRQYGLRQRVIRGLYHTYPVFVDLVQWKAQSDSRPRELIKWRCLNLWYYKSANHWMFYFKFKCRTALRRERKGLNMLHLLGDINDNPEENTQVMRVATKQFHVIPPLMGMTLCSVSVLLSQGLRHHKIHLGFSSSHHVRPETVPDSSIVLDTVLNIAIWNWWHPKYPHFENQLPESMIFRDDERIPVLNTEFLNGDS